MSEEKRKEKNKKIFSGGSVFLPILLVLFGGCNNEKFYSTKDGETLTQEQILKIANKEAKRLYFSPDKSEVLYDVGREKWRENLKVMEKIAPGRSKDYEILNDRNYVIVLYRPKDPGVIGGGTLAIYR